MIISDCDETMIVFLICIDLCIGWPVDDRRRMSIEIVTSQLSIVVLLCSLSMFHFSKSMTSLSMSMLTLRLFIRWISRRIIVLTILLFFWSKKYIEAMTYSEVWCWSMIISRTVKDVIIVRIDKSEFWRRKNRRFAIVTFDFVSMQTNSDSVFSNRATSIFA